MHTRCMDAPEKSVTTGWDLLFGSPNDFDIRPATFHVLALHEMRMYACMQRCSVLLTTGWGLSFGSPVIPFL